MKKIYYSIAEISEMFQIPLSSLRYWESQIKLLSPKRNDRGTRFYTDSDIEVLKQILYLRREEKLNIRAVKQKLQQHQPKVGKQQKIAESLQIMRQELNDIINLL